VKNSVNTPVFSILELSIRLDNAKDVVRTAEEIISGNEINWDDLYSGAELHSVMPQLAKLISRADPSLIPEEFSEKLNLAYRENLYRQMRFASEFLRISNVFSDAGIMVVPFKGFWFANEFYGNMADRESVDIDLFVNEDDLERISVIMADEDYQPQLDFLPYTIDEIRKNFHEYNFDRFEGDERIFHVEFHWRMSTEIYGMNITFEDLSSEIIKGKLQDHIFDVFSPSANLLLAVMHHGGRDLFRELKQVLDIGVILRGSPNLNWKWIMEKAEKFSIRNLVLIAVSLASELTDIEIPHDLTLSVKTKKIRKLTENRVMILVKSVNGQNVSMPGFSRWIFRMRAITNLKIRMRMTWLIMLVLIQKNLVPVKLRKYFPYSEFAA
jgi:hypothetical protein